MIERRLLQAAVVIACIVPVSAGLAGVVWGVDFLTRGWPGRDLDSHLRYLSGILLAIGIAFLTCVPHVERHRVRFGLLGSLVIAGGLARLLGLVLAGPAGMARFALVMELIITPLLVLWQRRVARLSDQRAASIPGPASAVGR